MACSGAPTRGPLLLFLDVRLARRNALHRQRQPPRRREGLGAVVGQARGHQLVGDELLQILRRPRLHARGNFLGEEFEQKVGHYVSFLWLPSHIGGVVVRLQVQNQTSPVVSGLNSRGRERRALVRAVAERLRLGAAAGAPPVALAGLDIDHHRLAAADLRCLAHLRPLPPRSSATPRRTPSRVRARAECSSAARSPRSRRARRAD